MLQPIYEVHYGDRRTSLVMKADLDRGWRKLKNTYGFFQHKRIPYRGDLSIKAQLAVWAYPSSLSEWAQTFPDCELEYGGKDFSYALRNRQLVVKVALLPHQPWRKTPQGRPLLYVRLPLLEGEYGPWCELHTWIVFHEGSRPVGDVRVWAENNLVIPGGQFESSRRRH